MLEVSLRQNEMRSEAAQARMAAQLPKQAPRVNRVFRPFGLRLAPAR
jgi:hypothetical protein